MFTLKDTYESRKREINSFIELMKFLEGKKISVQENEVSFDDFFYGEESSIDLSYQELINILKSNVSLMMYNIIEYTVSGLVDCIYDEIRMQNLSYIDVNESIREVWRKNILKVTKDPGAYFNTSSENFRPDILNSIKENRNNLAHGSVSFVDAVRNDSIQDFVKYYQLITLFLEELIDTVNEYIECQDYKL